MDAAEEVKLQLIDYANTDKDFHPEDTDFVQSIYTEGHGKGKLRFGARVVIGLNGNKTKVVLPCIRWLM